MIISFVIPTFNFAAFIPETLDSIVDEGFDAIEIIVFDGGSSDNTIAVLQSYKAKWPQLRVISAVERGNIDIDLNQAVAAATGDYIWTISADDVLLPGWSQDIVGQLDHHTPDLMLVPAIHCDIRMRPWRNYPILRNELDGELLVRIENDRDMAEYLAQIRSSEGLFSFCSACIVRRSRLLVAPMLEEANGTCWRYSARLIAILADYPSSILVLDRARLLKRGDNDSFSQAGTVGRFKIATTNWDRAIGLLNLNASVKRAMLTLVKSDVPSSSLIWLSQFIRNRDEKSVYDGCVRSRLADGGRYDRALAQILPRLPRLAFLEQGLRAAKATVRKVRQRWWEFRLPARARASRPRGVGTNG